MRIRLLVSVIHVSLHIVFERFPLSISILNIALNFVFFVA